MIDLEQTNEHGAKLKFRTLSTPAAGDYTFEFTVKYPHTEGGIQVEIDTLNPADPRQMRMSDDTTQVAPLTWAVNDRVQFIYNAAGNYNFRYVGKNLSGPTAPSAKPVPSDMVLRWSYSFSSAASVSPWYHTLTGSSVDDVSYGEDGADRFAYVECAQNLWWDPNHVLWLELLFQSWVAPGDPGAPGTKIGFPAVHDLRNAVLEFECRIEDFTKGKLANIALLAQTHVQSQQHFDDPTTQRSFVNVLQKVDVISEMLKFDYSGWDEPDAVRGVNDSGWVKCQIRLSTDPSFWLYLGGVSGRQGLPGDPLRYYNYVVEHPEVFLANFTGNFYIVLAHPRAEEGHPDFNVPPPNADKASGKFKVRNIRLLTPAV